MRQRYSRSHSLAAGACIGAVLVIATLLTLPGIVHPPPSPLLPCVCPGSGSAYHAETTTSPVVTDGQTIQTSTPVASTLTDSLAYGLGTGGLRIYWVNLTASVSLPALNVTLTTYPIAEWGLPTQLPGGADALPPLSLWNWTIYRDGVVDTSSWTETMWNQQLSLATTWTNQSFEVRGATSPQVTVRINPTSLDGTSAPGSGFVINTPGAAGGIPSNQSDFTSVAAALRPAIVRIGTDIASVSRPWNLLTDQPRYNFTYFDRLVNLSHDLHASIYLSIPAGSWGDGNLLPVGMPLNVSLLVQGPEGTGYYPADSAWVAWVEGLVNHTVATGAGIAYWNVGNEVPTYNTSVVSGYVNIFNIAQRVIHSQLPSALVGSDVMTNTTFEGYFAQHARKVGFLSFHAYPSIGLCVESGRYCAPIGPPNGTTDQQLLSHPAYEFMGDSYSPGPAQRLWHNLTGRWVPILNSESNLAGIGGNAMTSWLGTDPRVQTLFGATWVTSTLIDGAAQNVSDLAYFTFSSGWGTPTSVTSSYGGWGFGMTSESTNDSAIRYAPYFALQMWNRAIPFGAPGLLSVSSAPTVVEPYAAMNGANLSVFLVSRVNVPVSVYLNVTAGNYSLASVTTLDQRSYKEVYEPSLNRTVLQDAGTWTTHPNATAPITIDGYGTSVAVFDPKGSSGSGNQSGNGTGSGNSTGGGGGGGNSTGNGTGPGGNRTGNSTGPPPPSGPGDGSLGEAPPAGLFALSTLQIAMFATTIMSSGLVGGLWVGFLRSHPFRSERRGQGTRN